MLTDNRNYINLEYVGLGTIWLETVPALTIVHTLEAIVGYLDNVGLLTVNATLRKANLDIMEWLYS